MFFWIFSSWTRHQGLIWIKTKEYLNDGNFGIKSIQFVLLCITTWWHTTCITTKINRVTPKHSWTLHTCNYIFWQLQIRKWPIDYKKPYVFGVSFHKCTHLNVVCKIVNNLCCFHGSYIMGVVIAVSSSTCTVYSTSVVQYIVAAIL